MPLYTLNSTFLGSIRIMRTSSGLDLYSRLIIRQLMATLLPEPVCPAMSKCGILAISATIGRPVISFPRAIVTHDGLLRKASLSITSRKETIDTLPLGISIPTALFPGIGASMRTPVAAIARAISSASAAMRLTLTPLAIVSS